MPEENMFNIRNKINAHAVATVFGSSVKGGELFRDDSVETDDEWLNFTGTLASHEVPIINGGYQGTMKLVAERIKAKQGKCYGVISSSFDDKFDEELFDDLFVVDSAFERLKTLIKVGDIYIFLPGGIGSVVEVVCSLWYIDREFMKSKPLYFLGKYWKNFLNSLNEKELMFKNPMTWDNVKQFDDCESFLKDLDYHFSEQTNKDSQSYA